MNFLVSKNPVLIQLYWNLLLEQGDSLLLANFSDLMWRAKTSNSGLALIDLEADDFTQMQGISDLKRINQNLKVLIIAVNLSTENELAALAAGASGSCHSSLPHEKVRQIFTTVQDGGIWISSAGLPHLLQRLKHLETLNTKNSELSKPDKFKEKAACLTPREREIAALVAQGDSNKVIANKLNIADRTVKVHLSVIFQKLKVNDRLQLALLANSATNDQ